MANYATIKDGIVDNVIVWDGVGDSPVPDHEVVAIDGLEPMPWIGWSYDGSTFAPPAETKPAKEE